MIQLDVKMPDKLVHLADVHIRNMKRYEEYQLVFEQLYDDLDELSINNSVGTIIVGDLVHDKLIITNELQIFAATFISELSKRGPVFIIKGNHDYNELNPSRLNSIDPIIKNIDNVYFMNDNDLYNIKNTDIVFNVWEINSKFKDYKKDILKDYRQIVLYHGPVNGITNDDGFIFQDKNYITVDDLIECKPTAVLLGDIHKRNILHENPPVVMVGSTIQQHIRERVKNHGYCVWDTKDWSFEFKDIYNEYIHLILNIEDGKLIKEDKLTKDRKIHARIDILNTPNHVKDNIISDLKNNYNFVSILENKKNLLNNKDTDIDVNKLDKTSQISIIKEYMKNYDKKSIDNVLEKFEEISKKLKINNFTSSNVKLLTLEINNMFIFGKGVHIDFTNFNKSSVAIQGDNGSGKSSFFTALSYALFADSDKTYKPSEVLSSNKMDYSSKVRFIINDNIYSISRKGSKGYRDMVKEHVDFHNETLNESLNGVDRRETNRNIKSYIGDYELFDLTTLSTQSSSSKIIDKSSKNRREILSKILGFDMFEPIENQASLLHKKYKDLYNEYYNKTNNINIKDIANNILVIEEDLKELNNHKDLSIKKEHKLRKERDVILLSINESKVYSDDYEDILNQNISNINISIKNHKNKIKIEDKEIEDYLITKTKLFDTYPDYDLTYNTIIKLKDKLTEYKLSIIQQDRKIKNLKINHKNLLKTIDPDCKCSIKQEILDKISKLETQHKLEVKKGNILLNKQNSTLLLYNDNNQIIKDDITLKKIEGDIDLLTHSIDKTTLKLEKDKYKLSTLIVDLSNYKKNKVNIKNINNNRKKLSILDDHIKNQTKNTSLHNDNILKDNVKLSKLKDISNTFNDNINKVEEYSLSLKTYTDLKRVVSKDGIGLFLLKDKIKLLNNGVNKLISNITKDYTIDIIVNDNIDIIKVDRHGIKSSMVLASESQKFLTSLALRVILSEHGYIPRFNIIMIDEGFSTLDIKSKYKVEEFIKILLKYYDALVLISHDIELSNITDFTMKVKNKVLGSEIKIDY